MENGREAFRLVSQLRNALIKHRLRIVEDKKSQRVQAPASLLARAIEFGR
jgi:hypothetical protein